MRIVIDIQGAQTDGSMLRGIGRYTLALAQGIARLRGEHEIIIAASDAFPDSLPLLRDTFASILPTGCFCIWQCPHPINASDSANRGRRLAAELVREAFLASLRPDVILISSLFEGCIDNSVSSIGVLHGIPTAVILYDLIPLIHRDIYLSPHPVADAWYQKQLIHLRRANLLLGISASSCREAVEHLGFSDETVANIGGAADPQFFPRMIPDAVLEDTITRYGLRPSFVMYTGGIDHRKNIDRLIVAFARLPAGIRRDKQLVIVCKADENARINLQAVAERNGLDPADLVLTGFVPDEDLITLYHACTAFVFPSWHEGFGLPALEAMACGAPVIASNSSSLPEVVGLDEALFDPLDEDAIMARLEQVLTDSAYRERLIENGQFQASRFSWDITARRALTALEAVHLSHSSTPEQISAVAPRPRLAYVSPLPPLQSGISEYSAELLPALACFYDIELIVSQFEVKPDWIGNSFPIRSPEWMRANPGYYDRILYHFGNSEFHHHMFDLLRDIPGMVMLHDFFLSGVTWWMESTLRRPGYMATVLQKSHGYLPASKLSDLNGVTLSIQNYPCNRAVIENAIGIIVHSAHSIRLATQWYGSGIARDWSIIPLVRTPAIQNFANDARTRLKLPKDAIVVCSFGILASTKLNHSLLDSWFSSDLAENPDAYLVFVGSVSSKDYEILLQSKLENNPAGKRILITGWADAATYRDYLSAADIAVQLRTLSRGETSAAVLDCLNYGVATIVNANGSMADIDDEIVWKLPEDFETEDLAAALKTLACDTGRRKALGQLGQHYIHTRHAPRACAAMYYQSIEAAYQRAATTTFGAVSMIGRLTQNLTNIDLAEIAECLSQNHSGNRPRQLLIDITCFVNENDKAELQREEQEKLVELLNSTQVEFRIEPIRAVAEGYRYARHWTMRFLGTSPEGFLDDLVEVNDGDVFLELYLNQHPQSKLSDLHCRWRALGVQMDQDNPSLSQFFAKKANAPASRLVNSA